MGFSHVEESEFDRLLRRASDVLDYVTRDFYRFNDLESDIPIRRDKFKKAVATQIEYFRDMGATSSHELSEAAFVTIGRTTVSNGGRNQAERQDIIVSKDVYWLLAGTGLLYRGVGVV